jgi:hypothetical protein
MRGSYIKQATPKRKVKQVKKKKANVVAKPTEEQWERSTIEDLLIENDVGNKR